QVWDAGMAAYSPQYWQGVSFHVYPIANSAMSPSDEEMTLNGILAHGTTDWYSSTIQPLIGQNTPVFFSEMNSDGFATMPFESYIYNGIFLAEFIARMSAIPQVKAIGVNTLFLPNEFNQGYQGTDGTHYLLITNKSASSVPMAIEVDGNLVQSTVTVSYISNVSDTAQNTATNQNNVQIVTTTSPNPITVGPYSVTRVQW